MRGEEFVDQAVEGCFRQEEQLLIRCPQYHESIGLSGQVIGWEWRWERKQGPGDGGPYAPCKKIVI